jgi:hypothetical protein
MAMKMHTHSSEKAFINEEITVKFGTGVALCISSSMENF